MRGHPVFRELMHFPRAYLHLERPAVVVGHHRVQGPVAVRLGPRDVVVELLGKRGPHFVHHAQRGVAGADVVHDDAQGAQIVHLREIQPLHAHLVPDAVDVLGPAADLGVDAASGQRLLHAFDGRGDEGLALDPLFFEQAGDVLVFFGLEETERQVLHFPFDLPDAQPVGQRRVKVQGLAREVRRTRGLAFRMPAQRAQARRQAHQHDAQVGRHGKQHLALHFLLGAAFGGGIAGLAGDHAQPQQGIRALHQPCDFGAEGGGDGIIAQRRGGRHQVGGQRGQQRGGAGGGIGVQRRQDANDAGAMLGQGFARKRVLSFEAGRGPGNGPVDQCQAVGVQTRPGFLPPGSVEWRRRIGNRRGGHDGRSAGIWLNIPTLYTRVQSP